jgi:hypothetical protein
VLHLRVLPDAAESREEDQLSGCQREPDYNQFNNTFGPYGAFQSSPSGVEQQVYVMTATALAAATP